MKGRIRTALAEAIAAVLIFAMLYGFLTLTR